MVSSNCRYKDNSACVEMISGKLGDPKYLSMFSILDEQSSLPKCTDITLVDAFHKQFATHANYEKPRFGKESFVIKHFAGNVTYSPITWFLLHQKPYIFFAGMSPLAFLTRIAMKSAMTS